MVICIFGPKGAIHMRYYYYYYYYYRRLSSAASEQRRPLMYRPTGQMHTD